MLYRILKWLFYPAVNGYFRGISIKGRSNILESGPIIFVANHNSAFMDPILLGIHIKQSLYFLARGEAFKSKLSSAIFNFLNMIPVYRPEITPDEIHKNKEVFERCFDHLQKGKTLLIFPEGFSKTVRNLRRLKTGAARIALGAEDQKDFNLNVQIVPIGINYSDPHTFRSDVFINFGRPIEIAKFKEDYLKNEKDTVLKLTKDIKERLKELLVIVKDEKLSKLVIQIETLYRNRFKDPTDIYEEATESFKLSKDIAMAVNFIQKESPGKMNDLRSEIDRYFKKLDQLKLRDEQIKTGKNRLRLPWNVFYFIFGAPICVYGFLANILPYTTVRLLSAKIRIREDFIGSLKLALGAFVFLIFYILETVFFGWMINWYWSILFALSLYPAGLFTINYIGNFYLFQSDFRYARLFKRRRDLIEQLKLTRLELMKALEELRKLDLRNLN
ncbi:MAG: hypothetical protein HKO61_13870 [Flavobacteriaceae bacterium]|nr:hypothetical protein [Flavobacteriaceae bacterium]